jgi:hypothetical protein
MAMKVCYQPSMPTINAVTTMIAPRWRKTIRSKQQERVPRKLMIVPPQ